MSNNGSFERLIEHAEHVVVGEELRSRLADERPLRVKLGLDPTAKDVTLGWAVPLRKLRQFQDEGHTAVLIVGDFTARVGDPSGKSATRPQLSEEEVKAFAGAVLDQFYDVISRDRLEIRYNSEWLAGLDLARVLKLTSYYTVAQMLERDDFAKRYAAGRPISMVEFMYPLMQAYDSVAVAADVELGGTDQLFNLLVGRDLQRAYGQRPQVALTMPLLVGLDGVQKMSQSLGNYVGLREAPDEMFGKLMSLPDGVMETYAVLAAAMSREDVARVAEAARAGGPQAGAAKREVARAVVALYHGPDAAAGAEAAFDRVFRERGVPEEVPEVTIPVDAIDGDRAYLPRVLAELELASSRTEARRLIAGGAVRINGDPITVEEAAVDDLDGALLQVGKRLFVRLLHKANVSGP
jgi:tyrosyl-tRNA synthetase